MVDRTSPAFRQTRLATLVSGFVARLVIGGIRGYQLGISPYLPPRCRFYPSCSAYALEAVKMHGVWRGAALSAARVCRCNPWNPGGYDPVPLPKAFPMPPHQPQNGPKAPVFINKDFHGNPPACIADDF